jgi:hypothetical protein
MKVSFYNGITSTSPKMSKDVSVFLDRIREGKSKDVVAEIRATTDESKQQELKKQLPVVTFNGYFLNRSKNGLKKSSGLMVLDFDECKGLEDALKQKQELTQDKHIFSAWISPRLGVKALYRIIDVVDDDQFKKVFEQVKEKYPQIDDSGKDISRACFESYDPEIYINLNAEVFVPEVRLLIHEVENIGQITNIPVTDNDEIANRLVKWFSFKYDASQRNNSVFKLASAFNDFGVEQSIAKDYCMRYAQKDFKVDEIAKIIESAYKKTSQFGTKQFENREKIKRLKNMVVSGKKEKDILKEFEGLDSEKVNNEIEIIKSNLNVDVFWDYDHKGKMQINAYKFKLFLESLNYFKYYPAVDNKAFVFIAKDENFVEDVNEFQMKDKVMERLLFKNEIDVFNEVADNTKLFTPSYLSMIATADVSTEKDGKDYAMLYFQNNAVKVFFDKYEIYDYEELENHIWKNQVIKRNFIDADHHDSMFRTFVWLISGKEVARYNTLKSIIGYLLHSYKTSANNKAIILNDEGISEHPNGRSGKGLLINAISKMKKVSTIDGKNFDFGKSFPYQTVSTDCQVLAFDDVKKNFNFESLFSVITEGITLEYKNQGAIKLPVQESPKIMISTNYTIKAEGGSFRDRMFEVELSTYFGEHYSPFQEFGCMLFDDWDELEWARFDHFMINCLQYFLENGLVAYELKNLNLRKLFGATSKEFVQWMDEKDFSNGERIYYTEWLTKFTDEYKDFEKWLKQRTFNQWLKHYFDFHEIQIKSDSSNGKRYYELVSDKLKTYDNAKDDKDEVPF